MIFYERPSLTLHQGHALDVLREMPSESVHMVVTSPPYWGLRNYGIEPQIWPAYMDGGKAAECEHEWGEVIVAKRGGGGERDYGSYDGAVGRGPAVKLPSSAFCRLCGAWRGSLGLEPTPELFVAHIVEIFREVRRILRKDGVCFVNMGDGMWGGKGSNGNSKARRTAEERGYSQSGGTVTTDTRPQDGRPPGLKPKDLIGMPWRVAFALQADGWWLRQEIIWAKKAPMPESVTDRFTKAHEQIFLLTKGPRYFFDQEAVREPNLPQSEERYRHKESIGLPKVWTENGGGGIPINGGKVVNFNLNPNGRNMRDVWLLGPEPFPDAHFATFPSEVPRRCIKAGTSERGVCPQCGAPWKGQTKYSDDYQAFKKSERLRKGRGMRDNSAERLGLTRGTGNKSVTAEVHTLGWAASCTCGLEDTVPATVLDCFGGSGTVGIVANELGRRAVLIELNPDYCAMARERLRQEPLL